MTDDDEDRETPARHRVPTDSDRRAHFVDYPRKTPVVEPDPIDPDLYQRVQSLEDSRSFWRRVGVPLMFTAIAGLGGLLGYSSSQIQTSAERAGEVRADIKALNRLVDLLKDEISELRRHAGLTPHDTVAATGP